MIPTITPNEVAYLICLAAAAVLMLSLELLEASEIAGMPGCDGTVKILQFAPIIITRDRDIKNESVVIIDSARTVKKLQSEEMSRPPPEAAQKISK